MKKIAISIVLVIVTCLMASAVFARDLAGIDWEEFKNKSEFVFSGTLMKAELNEDTRDLNYTYKISNVFKGEEIRSVSFKASQSEDINKTVGRLAIVALKRVKGEWKLSIDERSCWIHENKMKEDHHGFPVYKIPTILLHNFPNELGEKVILKKKYGDDYRDEEMFVFPMQKVEEKLSEYLVEKELIDEDGNVGEK